MGRNCCKPWEQQRGSVQEVKASVSSKSGLSAMAQWWSLLCGAAAVGLPVLQLCGSCLPEAFCRAAHRAVGWGSQRPALLFCPSLTARRAQITFGIRYPCTTAREGCWVWAAPIGSLPVALQMQGAEAVPGGPGPRVFQPAHLPQQSPLSYFLHPQPQGRHAQGQPCNLPDLPEMQLPWPTAAQTGETPPHRAGSPRGPAGVSRRHHRSKEPVRCESRPGLPRGSAPWSWGRGGCSPGAPAHRSCRLGEKAVLGAGAGMLLPVAEPCLPVPVLAADLWPEGDSRPAAGRWRRSPWGWRRCRRAVSDQGRGAGSHCDADPSARSAAGLPCT